MQTRVRGGFKKREPYPLNQPTESVVSGICQRIVYQLASGRTDLSGDDWSRIFAESIEGINHASPLGLADVSWNGCCWSLKTVKARNPINARTVRLISGRNDPNFSSGISDPYLDISATGASVLSICNQRLAETQIKHSDVRLGVLVRNMSQLEFTYFERPMVIFPVNDYKWEVNRNNNLEGYGKSGHKFTWQPHGGQFTIKESVPDSGIRFRIVQRPRVASLKAVLQSVGFVEDWVQIIR